MVHMLCLPSCLAICLASWSSVFYLDLSFSLQLAMIQRLSRASGTYDRRYGHEQNLPRTRNYLPRAELWFHWPRARCAGHRGATEWARVLVNGHCTCLVWVWSAVHFARKVNVAETFALVTRSSVADLLIAFCAFLMDLSSAELLLESRCAAVACCRSLAMASGVGSPAAQHDTPCKGYASTAWLHAIILRVHTGFLPSCKLHCGFRSQHWLHFLKAHNFAAQSRHSARRAFQAAGQNSASGRKERKKETFRADAIITSGPATLSQRRWATSAISALALLAHAISALACFKLTVSQH